MARRGPRASKSHGRLELRPPSCLLFSLRLPSAAALFCANLRCLLDGVSRPERTCVRPLRRYRGRRANWSWPSDRSPVCAGPAALAPPPFVRAVAYGLYQGRMKEAIHALKYDRLHPAARGLGRMLAAGDCATGRRGARGDAGGSGAAAPVKICRARIQPGAVAGRACAGVSSQESSGVAAHAGLEQR